MNIIVLWSEDVILNNISKDLTKKIRGSNKLFLKKSTALIYRGVKKLSKSHFV